MSPTSRTGFIALAIVGGVFLVLALFLVFVLNSGGSGVGDSSGAPNTVSLNGPIERKALEKMLKGKGREEVLRLAGKPARIYKEHRNASYEDLIYENKTRHADATQIDPYTVVSLLNGVCYHVGYPTSNPSKQP